MQSKKKLRIEIGIVGLILIILGGVMLPKFLSSQRTGEPRRLINNLQLLVDGIKAYQADYDGVPASIATPMDAALQVMRPVQFTVSQQYWYQQLNDPYHFFYKNGYINHMPDYDLLDDFMKTKFQPGVAQAFDLMIQLKGKSVQSKAGIQKLEHYYIYQFWFKADPTDIEHFNAFVEDYNHPGRNNDPLHDRFESEHYWMSHKLLYAPSNGLHSAGYLYVDSLGRHSLK